MAPHGGFDHNAQSLRTVDWIEVRYPNFRGLNLSFEVREGIIKHSHFKVRPAARNSILALIRASRRRSSTSPTKSPTSRTTSTTG